MANVPKRSITNKPSNEPPTINQIQANLKVASLSSKQTTEQENNNNMGLTNKTEE